MDSRKLFKEALENELNDSCKESLTKFCWKQYEKKLEKKEKKPRI